MMINAKIAATASALATFLLLTGCGTGTYNERLEAKIAELNQKGELAALIHEAPTDIDAVSGLKLRLPATIDAHAARYGGPTADVPEHRVQPPFLKIPGYVTTYERYVNVGTEQQQNWMPVYAYFGVVPSGQQNLDALKGSVVEQLQKGVNNFTNQWLTAQISPPEGEAVSWEKIEVAGPQNFDSTKFASLGGKNDNFDGKFELYLRTIGQNHILVGWRAPAAAVDKVNFLVAAQASLGTVQAAGG